MDKAEVIRVKDSSGDFYEEIKESGCIICGTIGCGKTNFAKQLARQLVNEYADKDAIIRIFDVVGNWLFNFDGDVPSQNVYNANELRINAKVMVYRLNLKTESERIEFIKNVFEKDLERQKRLFDKFEGDKTKLPKIIYIVEEANTILSTYSIREGFFKDFVAFSRNFNIASIYVMQRLSDSSPKVIERIPNIAIGKTVGSNDLRRIKDIIPKKHSKTANFSKKWYFNLFFNDNLIPFLPEKFKGQPTHEYYIQQKTKGIFIKHTDYAVASVRGLSRFLEKPNEKDAVPNLKLNDRDTVKLDLFNDKEDFEDLDSESEIEIDESEDYPEDW